MYNSINSQVYYYWSDYQNFIKLFLFDNHSKVSIPNYNNAYYDNAQNKKFALPITLWQR